METKKTNESWDETFPVLIGSRIHPGKPNAPTDRKLGDELSQPFLWRSASLKSTNNTQWPLGTDSTRVESQSK
jgi:hypothetical protein